jgi:glycosyltransferase involved in cell wall biosynthesis
LNILIVTQQQYPHIGGMSTHIGYLLQGLKDLNIKTGVVAGRGGQPIWSKLLKKAMALGNGDRYARRLFEEQINQLANEIEEKAREFKPRIIHCHDVFAATLMALADNPRPIILTVHGPMLYEARQNRAHRPKYEAQILESERLAYAKTSRLITVDTGQANILKKDYGVSCERITIIHNCIDVHAVRRLSSRDTILAPGKPFFLVPRRLVPKTGVMYAIAALSQITSSDVHMVIAGDGPLRKKLSAMAQQLGISDRVHFLGSVPRELLLPLYSRAMAVLVPSVPTNGVIEATSLAVLEAMAGGTVPIASRIGGLAEIIEDHKTGLLVEPSDTKGLAAAMISVLNDTSFRGHIIKQASNKVESEYSLPRWIGKIVSIYKIAIHPEMIHY